MLMIVDLGASKMGGRLTDFFAGRLMDGRMLYVYGMILGVEDQVGIGVTGGCFLALDTAKARAQRLG